MAALLDQAVYEVLEEMSSDEAAEAMAADVESALAVAHEGNGKGHGADKPDDS